MKLLRRLRTLLRKRKLDAEMAEEMQLHLELQTEKNVAAGMSAEDARYTAQRQFGGVEQIKERCREQRGWGGLERAIKDLCFAGRSLRKTPGFTLVAIVTLALGIGLSTAVFSLMNAILLRPLPFADPDSLVQLRRSTPQNPDGAFAPADYLDLMRAEAPFGVFAGYSGQEVSLSEPGRPAEWQGARRVSADYFEVLRIKPEIGRTFLREEEINGRHRVVVLSHALWKNRFNASAEVIGRTVRIDGEEHEVVGVLPEWPGDDMAIGQAGLFRPLAFTDKERGSRTDSWVEIIGRRSATLTPAQGNEFIATFGARLAAVFSAENEGASWHAAKPLSALGNPTGQAIIAMLLGLSGCVLLIACSNLANFLLARTISRAHELSIRAALGASRLQLIRPLVAEALVLSLAGGGAALLVAVGAARWLGTQIVAGSGAPMSFPLDWRVLGFALGASMGTALLFGVAPALFALRVDVNDTLKRGGRGATANRGLTRLRHGLIIGQFALALTLVAGAGFFASGATNFLRQHGGWDSSLLAQGSFDLPKDNYPGAEQILAFDQLALERLALVPGVQAVSLSYGMPYDSLFGPRSYLVEGRDRPAKGQEPMATYNGVTADYFAVTGIRLLRGRTFNATDSAASPKVVIINESMARALFQDENPIGRRLAVAGTEKSDWAEIVGVVADVRSLAVYQRPIPFQTYQPLAQEPWPHATFAVRTAGVAPESVLTALRAAMAAIAPDLPMRELMTAEAVIEHSSFELILLRNMLGAFALLGVGLAALGVYGMIARGVAQRTSEIGIRVALGANASDIVRMILGSGVRLVLIGASLGVVGGYGLVRLIGSIMPSLQIDGDLVIGLSTTVLTLIALVACYLPARRAAKIDPVVALRSE